MLSRRWLGSGGRAALWLVVLWGLSGCQTLAYYGQAARGQLELTCARQPVKKLLARNDTAPELRRQLEAVAQIRSYASEVVGLPAKGQYEHYVALDRAHPVWAVLAAPELSLNGKRWCYPLVGCVDYRGYFRQQAADRLAAQLRAEGYDTVVSGVDAYSTLGWFRDPLLSSFIQREELELANLLIHELAHQRVYVADDTAFNEAYATAVAELALPGYAERRGLSLTSWQQRRDREREFLDLVGRYRDRLLALYRSEAPEAERRAGKAALFAALRAEHEALRVRWGGYGGYSRWIAQANNASMNSVALYHAQVPAFVRLWRGCRADWSCFHAEVAALVRLPKAMRQQRLKALMELAGVPSPTD